MKFLRLLFGLTLSAFIASPTWAQNSVPLPNRVINKLLPDYGRPKVYALNKADGALPGTLLSLNPTNGAILGEIALNVNPTDMAITPSGDALFVIHAGSRTISKVDLTAFGVVDEKAFTTPSTYSLSNPLYIVAGQSGRLFFTDGAWGPQIYFYDFNTESNRLVLNTGGNGSHGAGAILLNRSGDQLYIWNQYGWSAGSANAWVTRFDVNENGDLTTLDNSFASSRRDPFNTPLFLDAAERWVFNKQQMFAATNVSVLVNQFANNIYGISLDGSLAFGPSEVFNTINGYTITNLPFSTTVQTLSGDQKRLFRYQANTQSIVIFDMETIASVSGPDPTPTPADGGVVSLPLTNVSWTVSPLALAYDVYFGTNPSQVAAAGEGSALYLGRITAPLQALPAPLSPGLTYYWRVDVVGFSATNAGPVWSFTTSTLSVNPVQIITSSIVGYDPASLSIVLTAPTPVAWSATVTGEDWITLDSTSGTSPGIVTVNLHTAELAAGPFTNSINFIVDGTTLSVPVSLQVKALNITKMAADPQRPYLYAIQPPEFTGQSGLLLIINTASGNIDKTLGVGFNPVDLSINREDNRLYIASWTESRTYVVDLQTQTLLPSLNLGTDVYKINAGRSGRLVTEGEDQWVTMTLVNTANGASLASGVVREGDGDFDPTGRYYYHVDNNSSGAAISKYDTISDNFVDVASSGMRGSYFGSRNLVISLDGSRLFWTRVVFDANLASYDMVPGEVYSCSSDGRVAFGYTQAYDSQSRQVIYDLPVPSTVSVVDGQNQRFWYFANGTLGNIPMSVIQSPTITTQPAANTSVVMGEPVYLTVTAQGLSPLTYQWTLDDNDVLGETNYFLSLPELDASRSGRYRVIVSNSHGAVTSAVAQVNLLIPPSIAAHPIGTNVPAGHSFSLSVTAAGSEPFDYQWWFENSTIPDATDRILTIHNAQTVNEGVYRVIVNNLVGSATSAAAYVRVNPSAPVIVNDPASLVVGASSNATFSVQAQGSQWLYYQWLLDGIPIEGATGMQYSIEGVQAQHAGSYHVIVSNSLGSATSAYATLTVLPVSPYFIVRPEGATLVAGSMFTMTGLADGSQPISYQWQRNDTNVAGATTSSLVFAELTTEDSGGYSLLAFNAAGVSTSVVAQLTIYQAATFLSGLSNQVGQVGDTILLTVTAEGTDPLEYSWQFNGQPIPGSQPTLCLSNVQPSQSGYYRVTVSNAYSSESSIGRLSVMGAPSTVVAWGDNSGAQSFAPTNEDFVAVAGGDYHSIALRQDGTVLGWGYDGDGQVSVPPHEPRFVAIAAGGSHNLAMTDGGAIVGWGRNDYGQSTVPGSASNLALAIAAGDAHSLVLLSSGTVVAWGDNTLDQSLVPPGLTAVVAIAAGHNHSLALRSNATVVGWGFNLFGQTTPPASLTNAIAVAGGYLHSVALRADGTVMCWGDNTYGQTDVPAGLSNVVAIAAGDFHTYALRSDGTVVGWGDNGYGQLDVPPLAMNSLRIHSGFFHGLALVQPMQLVLHSITEGVVVEWTGSGTLQWSPTTTGPYSDLPGYSGIYTNLDMTTPARFFRLRR